MPNLYRFLPHRCFLCGAPADAYLCQPCEQDLPGTDNACLMCALPLASEGDEGLCGDCLREPKPFLLSVCPFSYSHPLNHLVQRLKTRDPHTLCRYLSPFLGRAVRKQYEEDRLPDALVPVPMHWFKRLRRGHNQAEVLCALVARDLGLPPLHAVAKQKLTQSQRALSRKARLANLRNSFRCRASVDNLHVAVVDDVVTTCATATSIAHCLLAAGARRVDIWALARTPEPGR